MGYAKAVGFTLSEIGEMLDAWYNKQFTIEQKIAILDQKLTSIDDKIAQLQEMKQLIETFKADVKEFDC